jgi:HJR/Mrr/RecB family endonuclease
VEILREISHRKFEELVASLYRIAGLEVELSQATRDHGADLLVWTPGSLFGGSFLTVVQVKKYQPSTLVGEGVIRDLKGVQFLLNAHAAECVTSSNFTRPAKVAARTLGIDLAALADLRDRIEKLLNVKD